MHPTVNKKYSHKHFIAYIHVTVLIFGTSLRGYPDEGTGVEPPRSHNGVGVEKRQDDAFLVQRSREHVPVIPVSILGLSRDVYAGIREYPSMILSELVFCTSPSLPFRVHLRDEGLRSSVE